MKKVIVIGCPGAGKSTFARRLRDATGLPLHYLDMLYHKPDKTTLSREEFDRRLDEIMAGDSWIIDGNYRRTMERRLERCETAIFLDFPTEVCLSGAEERIGMMREDLPWTASMDDRFRQKIVNFSESQRADICGLLERYRAGREILIFHSRAEADAYLDTLAACSGI